MSHNLNKLVQPECGGSNPLVAAAHLISTKPSAASRMVRQGPAPVNFAHEFLLQRQQRQHNQLANSNMITSILPSQQTTFGQFSGTQNSQSPLLGINNANTGRLAIDFLKEHEVLEDIKSIRLSTANMTETMNSQPIYSTNLFPTSAMGHPSLMGLALDSANPRSINAVMNLNQNALLDREITAGDQLETKYRDDMISLNPRLVDMQSPSTQSRTLDKKDDLSFWQTLSQKYIGPSIYDNINKLRSESSTLNTDTNFQELDEKITEQLRDSKLEQADVDTYDVMHDPAFPKLDEYIFDDRNPLKDEFEDPFAEGLKKLEEGDIPSAVLLFEAAVLAEPENALAWRYLGTTQAQNEKDSSAIRALRNCLKFNPEDQEARLAIAVSLANENQQRDACRYLIEWLTKHDKYRAINASLEEFDRIQSADKEEWFNMKADGAEYVVDQFVNAARMSPSNPDAQVQSSLGVLFNMLAKYDKAVDCFKAALSVRSEDSILWNRLGATLANGNKSDEAVVAYRKALEISPGFLRSRYNLAISLVHLNAYDEAAKQLVHILNMQAAGKGSQNVQIRTRSITSTAVWNTLRTVATLMNKPSLYSIIDGRDLSRCNQEFLKQQESQGN